MATRSELLQAYLQTTYFVDAPAGQFGIRIGCGCAELDALLHQHGHRRWAYVTACNPHSQILSAAENAMRMDRLREQVRRAEYTMYAGAGVGLDGWEEASLLILGIPPAQAIELGRQFEQNAIVAGSLGEPARLMECDPSPV